MKTPREILMAHHRAATPKLDAIRESVVATVGDRQSAIEGQHHVALVAWLLDRSNTLWRELVLPSRRVWSGLAAVWLLIVAVNLSQRDPSPAAGVSPAPAMMSFREQQRLMNELFADRSPPLDIEPPKTFLPKPRTGKAGTVAV